MVIFRDGSVPRSLTLYLTLNQGVSEINCCLTKYTVCFLSFGTGTMYDFEILQPCDKRVETKSQISLRSDSNLCRSYRGITGGPSPILNRIRNFASIARPFLWVALYVSIVVPIYYLLHWKYSVFFKKCYYVSNSCSISSKR